MLTCLVPVLFTIYTQGVLKLKKKNSGAKGLISIPEELLLVIVRGTNYVRHARIVIHPDYTRCDSC